MGIVVGFKIMLGKTCGQNQGIHDRTKHNQDKFTMEKKKCTKNEFLTFMH